MPQPIEFSSDECALVIKSCHIGTAAIFAYLLIYHLHHQLRGHGGHVGDFSTFYLAAQSASEHRDIYKAGTSPDMIYVYPPLIAFLFRPFALLTLSQAAAVYLVINVAMLFASLWLAARAIVDRLGMPKDIVWPTIFTASLLMFNQMRAVLTMGETDGLMLFMFVLAFHWLDARPRLAGWALAVAFNIKYLSIVAIPYLLIRRRWSTLLAMSVGIVVLALVPALELGLAEDLRCLRVSMGGLLVWFGISGAASGSIRVHDTADSLSVSITSCIARALGHGAGTRYAALAVAGAVGVLMLAIACRIYRDRRLPFFVWPRQLEQLDPTFRGLIAIEWASLIAMSLIFSPDTNTRHMVMATVVGVAGTALIIGGREKFLAAAGTLLIFLAFIMPFGREIPRIGAAYYRYSIPGWGLAIGFLLIAKAGLAHIRPIQAGGNIASSRRADMRPSLPVQLWPGVELPHIAIASDSAREQAALLIAAKKLECAPEYQTALICLD